MKISQFVNVVQFYQERATVRDPFPPEIFGVLDAQMSMYCNSKQ